MERCISLLGFRFFLFLLMFTLCTSFPLAAEGIIKISGTSEGVESKCSIATTVDLGAVGMLSLHGDFTLTAQDLLATDQSRFMFSGGFGIATPSAVSFTFGDLAGTPAVGLLLEPHLLP